MTGDTYKSQSGTAKTEDRKQKPACQNKKTKQALRKEPKTGEPVRLRAEMQKSCLIDCAETVRAAVRRIDFRIAARLNRAMTGENLRHKQIWNKI